MSYELAKQLVRDSPTQRIGAQPRNDFGIVRHVYPDRMRGGGTGPRGPAAGPQGGKAVDQDLEQDSPRDEAQPYPLMQMSGSSRATLRASPAASAASTTADTSL